MTTKWVRTRKTRFHWLPSVLMWAHRTMDKDLLGIAFDVRWLCWRWEGTKYSVQHDLKDGA